MSFPVHPSTLKLLEHAWITILAPPPKPRGLLEFCRTLKVCVRDEETGEDRWETFDPTGHPAQLEVLQAFRAGECDEMVVLGPVQDGKTYALIICCLLYCLIELRQSAGLMLPEQEKAEEIWLEKIIPVIINSGYQWILPTEGRGSKSGAARFIQLQTGATVYLIGAGAKNESAQSSFTVRFMFLDEASAIRPHLIQASRKRTASYDRHGRNSRTTTIKHDDGDPTVQAYGDSTGHANWFQCPHCVASNHPTAGWQPFDFDMPAIVCKAVGDLPAVNKPAVEYGRLHYDPDTDTTARDTARLVCLHDHTHLLTNAQRRDALRNHRHVAVGQSVNAHGQVIGTPLPNSRKGIRWNSMESPIKSLGKLAVELRKALIARERHNDHSLLRQFRRDECVAYYTGDRDRNAVEITANGLSELSQKSDYDQRQVPTWVELLTVGQDVQKDRHYWLVLGHGPNGRRCVIDWGYELCVPLDGAGNATRAVTDTDHHRVLGIIEATCADGWQVEGTENRMMPEVGGVDVNYLPGALLPWIVGHPQWMPCIGVGGERAEGMARTSMREGKSVLPVEVAQELRGTLDIRQVNNSVAQFAFITRSQVQQTAHAGMMSSPGEPGSLMIPRNLRANAALLLHLSSRVWTRDDKTGRWYWREVRRRDDWLACLVIADALARFWRVYQPWLATTAAPDQASPTKPRSQSSVATTPDGRPLLLSDR